MLQAEAERMTMQEQIRNADFEHVNICRCNARRSPVERFMAWGVYNYTHNRKTPVRACIRLLWRNDDAGAKQRQPQIEHYYTGEQQRFYFTDKPICTPNRNTKSMLAVL